MLVPGGLSPPGSTRESNDPRRLFRIQFAHAIADEHPESPTSGGPLALTKYTVDIDRQTPVGSLRAFTLLRQFLGVVGHGRC